MIAAVADAGDGITDDHAELYIYNTVTDKQTVYRPFTILEVGFGSIEAHRKPT